MGTLFIQPHSDDMVMSSYFLIRSNILPKPYYCLTVFTRSNWIETTKRKKFAHIKGVTAITNLRKSEDKKFAKQFDLIPLFLNFKACFLRAGKTFFSPQKNLDISLLKLISTSIKYLIRQHKIANIVLPFPFGRDQHYDHRMVCEAVKKYMPNYCNVYFVDDLPYGRIMNASKYNLRIFAKIKINDMHKKFRAMKIYDSQMCNSFFNQISKITKQNKGYERVFILNNEN
jgi:LmbE family N-acetylglucosaminyl deacetylase